MSIKNIKITFWALTIIFSLAMLGDAFGGIMHEKTGVVNMQHLGYPVYMMTIMGFAKLLGVIAIVQTRFIMVKEWAYSGFTISFIGALWSRIYMGDDASLLLPPIIIMAIMFASYFFWKKYLRLTIT